MDASAEHVEVVVVGSGFGGGVSAYRLAEAGHEVVVLERGKAFPPGSFPRSPAGIAANVWDPAGGHHGMFDLWSFQGLEAVVAAGLGGGSLIYANVLIRKDEHWFVHSQPVPGGGYESWPVSRADLDPHYDRVEQMLGARAYPYAGTTRKTTELLAAAAAAGLDADLPPLAVAFSAAPGGPPAESVPLETPAYGNLHGLPRRSCNRCGECDFGCNAGSKNTLDHTYLSAAVHHGADLRTRHEVRAIAALDGGGYEVHYVVHDEAAEGRPTDVAALPLRRLVCDRLVLAAGTLGTTSLLLRSRAALPALSPAVGSRFSGNGDLLGLLLDAVHRDGTPRLLEGSVGPVITTRVRVPDAADGGADGAWPPPRGHYVEDAGYPVLVDWLVELAGTGGLGSRAARVALAQAASRLRGRNASTIGDDVAALLGSGRRSSSSMALLGMGRDVPDGVMRLRDGLLDIDWTTLTSRDYIEGVRTTMRTLADGLGADFHDNPLWALHRVITVHPLGGAPMSDEPALGVCDPFGRVHGHPGLYVADGALMPGAVGPNPSLTIAALADRLCDRIAEEGPAVVAAAAPRVAVPTPPAPAGAGAGGRHLEFTERMAGWAAWGEHDPAAGRRAGRSRGEALSFRLTIATDDLDRFLDDPEHEGTASGTLDYDPLGGELPVLRGWFNLFTVDGDATRRAMRYRLHVLDSGGNPVTFVGRKDVHDDPGADVWADTTTLFVRLVPGHVGEAEAAGIEPLAAGIITITPQAFAKQLTTFRVSGPGRLRALAAFNALFLGQVWAVYSGRVRRAVPSKGGTP